MRLGRLGLWLLLAGSARAEEPLTLPQALSLARTHNRDLAVARARLAQARVGVEQAWVPLLPTVALQGRYTHNYKGAQLPFSAINQGTLALTQALEGAEPALAPALAGVQQQLSRGAPGVPAVVTIQKEEQLDSAVNATVPLLSPSTYAALNSAHRTLDASDASFALTEASVLFTVAQAFYTAAGADELLIARKDSVELARQTLSNAQAKLAAGTAKRTDLTQAQLALLQAQQALLSAQESRDQAYRALATLVQRHEPFRVVTAEGAPTPPGPAEALTTQALAHRPELRAYAKGAEASRAQERAAEWAWAPTLSAFGRATVQNYAGFTGDDYSWAVGVQLDWVLYDGNSRSARAHLARAQAAEQEARLRAEADTVRDEVENALGSLSTARAGLASGQQSVELARETLRLMRVQYGAGLATQLDVLQAQDAVTRAEVSLAQARFNLALARLTLCRVAGLFPGELP